MNSGKVENALWHQAQNSSASLVWQAKFGNTISHYSEIADSMSATESGLSSYRPGCTVVTATQRLARYLSENHDQQQLAAGATAWEMPDILPWDTWCRRQWSRMSCENKPMLLGDAQEQILWERAIRSDIETRKGDEYALWQLDKTAAAARSAWRLLHDWKINTHTVGVNEDHLSFQRWANQFKNSCDKAGFIDSARLVDALFSRADTDSRPCCLILAGFDQILPVQQALLNRLESSGCEIHYRSLPIIESGSTECREYPDVNSELHAAASWARQMAGFDSKATIGVVVPELETHRDLVERHFENVFYPNAVMCAQPVVDKSFHISLGMPLASLPLVQAAMMLIKLMRYTQMPLSEFSFILRSGLIGGAEQERTARAQLDAKMRSESGVRVTWHDVLDCLQKSAQGNTSCPVLTKQINQAIQFRTQIKDAATPKEWAHQFTAWLRCFSWPGERTLDTMEYQAVEAWDALLADFAALESIESNLTQDAAIKRLAHMANRTFQPEEHPAPVQILGVLEAGGMAFTHLWITGLHDTAWPARTTPNPFLPIAAQRAAGVPQADVARAHEQSQGFFQRLCDSAADIVLSYPRTDGITRYGPSSLLEFCETHKSDSDPRSPRTGFQVEFERPPLETFPDHSGLPANEGVTGNTSLFTDQSACPFRAYARHRLGACSLKSPEQGLDAMQRGTVMHKLLEQVWEELKSHAGLCARSDNDLRELVRHAANAVLSKDDTTRRFGVFMQLETERLTELVLQWLELERMRESFVVESRESKSQGLAGKVTVNLRPDRVDRLDDGSLVIIDYKTGKVDRKDWLDERPKDPQLPLYRLLLGDSVQGIAYGSLNVREIGFDGLASRAGIAQKIDCVNQASKPTALRDVADWSTLTEIWDEVLHRLSAQFCAGDARVDPRDGNVCRYCDIRPLCRVDRVTDGMEEAE